MDPKLEELLAQFKQFFSVEADGRITCLANGHAFPPKLDVLDAFIHGKKFPKLATRYQAEQKLGQFEPYIVQSKNFPHMLYCTVTGQLMDKSVAAVKVHMGGKKYIYNKAKIDKSLRELKPEPDVEEVLGIAKRTARKVAHEDEEEEDESGEGEFDIEADMTAMFGHGGAAGEEDGAAPSKAKGKGKRARAEEEEEEMGEAGSLGSEDGGEDDGDDEGEWEEGSASGSGSDEGGAAPASDDFEFGGEGSEGEEEEPVAPPPKKGKAAGGGKKAAAAAPARAPKAAAPAPAPKGKAAGKKKGVDADAAPVAKKAKTAGGAKAAAAAPAPAKKTAAAAGKDKANGVKKTVVGKAKAGRK